MVCIIVWQLQVARLNLPQWFMLVSPSVRDRCSAFSPPRLLNEPSGSSSMCRFASVHFMATMICRSGGLDHTSPCQASYTATYSMPLSSRQTTPALEANAHKKVPNGTQNTSCGVWVIITWQAAPAGMCVTHWQRLTCTGCDPDEELGRRTMSISV